MTRDVYPGSGSWFLAIPDPGGQKGIGSRFRNTGRNIVLNTVSDPEQYVNYGRTSKFVLYNGSERTV